MGEFHTDGDYHHGPGEVNFWVPVTPTGDSNSVWVDLRTVDAQRGPWIGDYFDVFDAREAGPDVGNAEDVARPGRARD